MEKEITRDNIKNGDKVKYVKIGVTGKPCSTADYGNALPNEKDQRELDHITKEKEYEIIEISTEDPLRIKVKGKDRTGKEITTDYLPAEYFEKIIE